MPQVFASPDTDLSFAVWRSPTGFHIASMRDDEQVRTEVFASLKQVFDTFDISTARIRAFA